MFGMDEYNYHNTFTGDCFKGQYEICTKNRGGKCSVLMNNNEDTLDSSSGQDNTNNSQLHAWIT